jgi:Glyoxalase-like domain
VIKRLQAVALDCADPVRLAEFYAELLGGRVVMEADEPDWVEVVGFDGTPLAFQRVDGYRPPGWPGREQWTIDATTGIPISFGGGGLGQPLVETTYQVSRVTLAQVAQGRFVAPPATSTPGA